MCADEPIYELYSYVSTPKRYHVSNNGLVLCILVLPASNRHTKQLPVASYGSMLSVRDIGVAIVAARAEGALDAAWVGSGWSGWLGDCAGFGNAGVRSVGTVAGRRR